MKSIELHPFLFSFFQVSEISESTKHPRGSESHANIVETSIRDIYKSLPSSNIFRPKVLAKASHNNNWFVGSSISVSQFLRPLCLYNRISGFKYCLMKAIIYFNGSDTLTVPDNQIMNWSCEAFNKWDYCNSKDPCQNCQTMFENLEGFISVGRNLENAGNQTFLGACAEYCPVNDLLKLVDDDQALSESDISRLEANRKRCSNLFEKFRETADECHAAYSAVEDAFSNVRANLHTFGLKPEYNHFF